MQRSHQGHQAKWGVWKTSWPVFFAEREFSWFGLFELHSINEMSCIAANQLKSITHVILCTQTEFWFFSSHSSCFKSTHGKQTEHAETKMQAPRRYHSCTLSQKSWLQCILTWVKTIFSYSRIVSVFLSQKALGSVKNIWNNELVQDRMFSH